VTRRLQFSRCSLLRPVFRTEEYGHLFPLSKTGSYLRSDLPRHEQLLTGPTGAGRSTHHERAGGYSLLHGVRDGDTVQKRLPLTGGEGKSLLVVPAARLCQKKGRMTEIRRGPCGHAYILGKIGLHQHYAEVLHHAGDIVGISHNERRAKPAPYYLN